MFSFFLAISVSVIRGFFFIPKLIFHFVEFAWESASQDVVSFLKSIQKALEDEA